MPRVSEFLGIAIYFYFNDHQPPHFHAEYGGHEALYEIATLRVYAGKLPKRAHNLILEWADLHRNELMANWERARAGMPLLDIDALE